MKVSVEEAELPALLKIAEALKVNMSFVITLTRVLMTMTTMSMIDGDLYISIQVKGLVESEEERQGGSAKATPVRSSKKKTCLA